VSESEAKFVRLMNKKARSIGAKNTRFRNSNGLPRAGQYTTASDMAKIMRYALGYQKFKDIIGTRLAEVSIENRRSILVENTNKLLWSDEDLVGGKTGYTRKARHCFVCAAERDDETVIVALLGSPSRKNLWKESEVLIGKGFDILSNKEHTVIYSTKNTVYKNGHKSKKASKSKRDKALIAKNIEALKSAKLLAKKKDEEKAFTKYRKKKSGSIAKKSGVKGNKG
jgi:D-alanyl-D-alanine carboxypeptidase (penicillin-binding protein 5/6)